MTKHLIWAATLILLISADVVSAAVPSVELQTSLSKSQRILDVIFSPQTSADGCVYTLWGSPSRRMLRYNLNKTVRLYDTAGAEGRTVLRASLLNRLRKVTRSESEKIYFVGEITCDDQTNTSNIAHVRFSVARGKGSKSIVSWLRKLRGKLAVSTLNIAQAFPNLSFQAPVAIVNAGDGSDRIFVVEQGGKIYEFPNSDTVTSAALFLDLSSKISTGGERGLLGLAFHPNYKQNGYFYVNYTAKNTGATVVARYSVSTSDVNIGNVDSEIVLLTIAQPYANHNGGNIAFGGDGYLYIGMGDGGSGGDPLGNGQNRQSLLGKMLRIDVDHPSAGRQYGIPSDNPFAGNSQGYKEEIFAYGLRNPWRFSFDSTTGKLWAGDVGQNSREEIDIIESGKNYGWNTMEGFSCYSPSSGCDQTGLELPLYDYSHVVGNSITGGFVYRGTNNPTIQGLYVYADFISGRIWGLNYDGTTAQNIDLFSTDSLISSFGVDENKELYFLSYGDGRVYTLVSD